MKKRILQLYEGTSIKIKWIIFVIILVLYPMILLGYVGYANYEQIITKHFTQAVQKDILVVANQLQEELQDIEKFTEAVQKDEVVYNYTSYYYDQLKVNNIDRESMEEDPDMGRRYEIAVKGDYALTQSVRNYLKSLVLARQDVEVAAYQFADSPTFGYEGFGYQVCKDKNQELAEEKSFKRNKVYENMNRILENQKVGYYVDDENNIYLGKKIFYRTTGKHCGNAIFKLDVEYLLRKYASMVEGANEGVYVLANKQKEIVSAGNLSDEGKQKLVDFQTKYPQPGLVYREESKSQAIVYNTFQHHNISIGSAVYISTDILLADIRAMSRFIFLLCMSILPIFILLANKLYKEVIQPIYILSGKMQQIEKGEMGVEVKSNRTDEFGYVFGAFNGMSRQLKYLVNCVYKEQIALKSAELKALRSQINPHFLYNTLEMINWKARMSGNNDISEMIEALSGILEVNIDRRDSHFLTVAQEAEYIRNYIFLIQKRFGDSIHFEINMEEGVLEYKIPKLILQPIVENALSHGVETLGKGLIIINIKDEGERLEIEINDNGRGIEEGKLIDIIKQLEKPEKNQLEVKTDQKGHIGVINVQKRIKLLYGDTFGLSIKSKFKEGTQVKIILPKTLTGELREGKMDV